MLLSSWFVSFNIVANEIIPIYTPLAQTGYRVFKQKNNIGIVLRGLDYTVFTSYSIDCIGADTKAKVKL